MSDTVIFALESSCDETAAAIVKNGCEILANVVATQIDVHKDFGGVIPEVASRIHVENISMVIAEALKQADMTMEEMDAIAITQGPGLIGSLHVGVQAAKTLAYAFDKPLVPVHHIAGHIYANRLVEELHFPLLALVVSGGHTELVYMECTAARVGSPGSLRSHGLRCPGGQDSRKGKRRPSFSCLFSSHRSLRQMQTLLYDNRNPRRQRAGGFLSYYRLPSSQLAL